MAIFAPLAGWGAGTPAGRRRLRQGLIGAQRFPAFHPYAPPPLPSGTFDPALDAARRAASRGLGDLQLDTATAGTRDTVDYGLGRDSILRDQTRGNEDIARQVGLLRTSYEQLANSQRQGINAAGLGSGAALQAAAKRQANQQVDMQPLDTARTRLGEDTSLRLGQLALEMAPPGEGGPLGGRRFQDRSSTFARAGREDVNFGLDTEAQKAFQAAGAGYLPPVGPANEFRDAQGNPYRVIARGGRAYRVDPSGKVISSRPRRRR